MSDAEAIRVRRPPPAFRRAVVTTVRDRSPRLRSVTLAGPEVEGLAVTEPAASLRLLVPSDGHLELPGWNGNEFLFADGSRPPIRSVTPLAPEPGAGVVRVDIVLHGDGPMSAWARGAEVGDEVAISGPGRGYSVDPDASHVVLAGDESALPAVTQLLGELAPDASVEVVLETAHPDGRVEDLPAHPGATVRWVDQPAGQRSGSALVAWFETWDVDPSARVWVAGEAAAVQRIRTLLFGSGGIDRTRTVIRGYWKTGVAWDG